MPIFGFVMKKAVTSRHSCGTVFVVKTTSESQVNLIKGMMFAYPRAEVTTDATTMVLVTGGKVQKTSMVDCGEMCEGVVLRELQVAA